MCRSRTVRAALALGGLLAALAGPAVVTAPAAEADDMQFVTQTFPLPAGSGPQVVGLACPPGWYIVPRPRLGPTGTDAGNMAIVLSSSLPGRNPGDMSRVRSFRSGDTLLRPTRRGGRTAAFCSSSLPLSSA